MTDERPVPGAGEGAHADPATAEQPRRRHRRVVRQGAEHDVVPGPSSDEVSTGWSEGQDAAAEGNDARLTRDVPPHW